MKNIVFYSLYIFFFYDNKGYKSLSDLLSLAVINLKHFVITNSSKERPGSIVTETLKNRILTTIVTSKESHLMLI